MGDLILLRSLDRFSPVGLLSLRAFIGAFLIWGVWDNVVNSERMQEFIDFLAKAGFVAPELMGPLSVWVQLAVGVSFIVGGLTRWAGVICALNFLIAIIMVDRFAGIRGAFPSACLVMIGVYLALRGAGRFSVDALFEMRRRQEPP